MNMESQPKENILLLFCWLDEVYSIHGGQRLPSSVYVFYHCNEKNDNQATRWMVNAAIKIQMLILPLFKPYNPICNAIWGILHIS
jgi:hypothetical protein